MALQPARKAALRAWFEGAGQQLLPGDQLLLFVTDHGTKNEDDLDNGAISLWQEDLNVEELRAMLALLPSSVRVVMMMSLQLDLLHQEVLLYQEGLLRQQEGLLRQQEEGLLHQQEGLLHQQEGLLHQQLELPQLQVHHQLISLHLQAA